MQQVGTAQQHHAQHKQRAHGLVDIVARGRHLPCVGKFYLAGIWRAVLFHIHGCLQLVAYCLGRNLHGVNGLIIGNLAVCTFDFIDGVEVVGDYLAEGAVREGHGAIRSVLHLCQHIAIFVFELEGECAFLEAAVLEHLTRFQRNPKRRIGGCGRIDDWLSLVHHLDNGVLRSNPLVPFLYLHAAVYIDPEHNVRSQFVAQRRLVLNHLVLTGGQVQHLRCGCGYPGLNHRAIGALHGQFGAGQLFSLARGYLAEGH